MPLRFYRRFKIAPGLRINLSRSGISTSVGRRGACFTIGPRGTRETIGIPGTRLSYSEHRRIDALGAQKKNAYAYPSSKNLDSGLTGPFADACVQAKCEEEDKYHPDLPSAACVR